jgi:hypothetical protein
VVQVIEHTNAVIQKQENIGFSGLESGQAQEAGTKRGDAVLQLRVAYLKRMSMLLQVFFLNHILW